MARQSVTREEAPNPLRRLPSNGLPEDPRGDTGALALSSISNERPELTKHDDTPPSSSHSNSATQKRPRRRRRDKARSLLRRYKTISLRHTWLNPLIVVLALLGFYFANPGTQNPLHRAIFLSYPLDPSDPLAKTEDAPPGAQMYGKGGADFAFVAFYMVVLSFTREFIMQRVVRPLAIRAGIKSKAKQTRFMEQLYTAIYFAVFGPYGLWVMSRSPVWYFNTTAMYEGFPHRSLEGYFKAYYLLQAAYWAQQAVVLILQLEKPRKDFKELVGHHVITVALIWCSYRFHFTYMGIAVYITHDVSDFFLATSKCLNYIDHPFTLPYFAFFMGVWAYGRHYISLCLIWSVLTTFKTVGPFDLNWETQQYKCWISQAITFALLAALQSVNLFWFFLICRIAYNYAVNDVRKDERSDYEEEDEDGETTAEKRERMGIPPPEEAPLLNGKPVMSGANGHVPVSGEEKANGKASALIAEEKQATRRSPRRRG